MLGRIIGALLLFAWPTYVAVEEVMAARNGSPDSPWYYAWILPYVAASIAWIAEPKRFPLVSQLFVVLTALFTIYVVFSQPA